MYTIYDYQLYEYKYTRAIAHIDVYRIKDNFNLSSETILSMDTVCGYGYNVGRGGGEALSTLYLKRILYITTKISMGE